MTIWYLQRRCGNSSVGRAQASQAWGREFESRFPLPKKSLQNSLANLSLRLPIRGSGKGTGELLENIRFSGRRGTVRILRGLGVPKAHVTGPILGTRDAECCRFLGTWRDWNVDHDVGAPASRPTAGATCTAWHRAVHHELKRGLEAGEEPLKRKGEIGSDARVQSWRSTAFEA